MLDKDTKFFITQSGRSMVEMLGTLTIMGVLSVVGVMGYNWAMNKHHANTLYDDMKLAYMAIHTTHSPNFRPRSNYELQVRRDLALNSLLKYSFFWGAFVPLFLSGLHSFILWTY